MQKKHEKNNFLKNHIKKSKNVKKGCKKKGMAYRNFFVWFFRTLFSTFFQIYFSGFLIFFPNLGVHYLIIRNKNDILTGIIFSEI